MKTLLKIMFITFLLIGCTKQEYEDKTSGCIKTDSIQSQDTIIVLEHSTRPLYWINDSTFTTRPDTLNKK